MKKSVLALVAVLGLGLASCDRDERVLEVEKKVEVKVPVDLSGLLEGKWTVKEAKVGDKAVVKASDDNCLSKVSLEFKEGNYTFNIVDVKGGQCNSRIVKGTYLYDSFQGIVLLDINPDYPDYFNLNILSEDEIELHIFAEDTGKSDAEDLVLTLTK